jgi:hypothetical protein
LFGKGKWKTLEQSFLLVCSINLTGSLAKRRIDKEVLLAQMSYQAGTIIILSTINKLKVSTINKLDQTA